jgi:predicted enzyme related to lactoylglutathione lyase
MSNPFTTHGAISWCELQTTDPSAAKAFYSKLFGWEVEENAMGHVGYSVAKVGGEAVAGIMAMPPGAQGLPPMWSCYVTVKDARETAKLAESLGGKVLVAPMDIPGVGTSELLTWYPRFCRVFGHFS